MDRASMAFLKNLVECASPSGFEQEIQRVVRERLSGAADEIHTDVLGNVIAVLNPGAPLRVMLGGHCDEIGLMVTNIDDSGYVHFAPMAWWDPIVLGGQWVDIHDPRGVVPGVIPRKTVHLQQEEDYSKVPKFHQYWIDIGARSKADALKAVAIGDTITICRAFRRLRNDLFTARGLDDRVGVWVMVEAMRRLRQMKLHCAVYGVSTVQEEIGMRGAQVASFGIEAHVGIHVEIGFAADFPDADKRVIGECKAGKGPIIFRGANINPKLSRIMERAAARAGIKTQTQPLVFPLSSGTDAYVMQVSRCGMATVIVGLPTRYLHSSVEVGSLKDLDKAVALVVATIADLKPGMNFVP